MGGRAGPDQPGPAWPIFYLSGLFSLFPCGRPIIPLWPAYSAYCVCFLGLNLPSYEDFHSEGEKLCELFSALPKLEMLSIFVFMPDKQTALGSQEAKPRSYTFRPPACLLDWMEKNLTLKKFEPMGSGVNIMLGRD